jgi:uncharacterized membrane protein YcgQ (UPF0703/DUF1980 family)
MKKLFAILALGLVVALAACQAWPPAADQSAPPKGATVTVIEGGITLYSYANDPTAPASTTAHSGKPSSGGSVVEIKEKMFVAQTNYVYYNAADYLGKTIKYEGIFDVYEVPETGAKYYSVIRYGPGCCGIDANAGFEVVWDKGYPKQNDWVEAVGVLEEYEGNGYKSLRLALSSLTVLAQRGAEYVAQ